MDNLNTVFTENISHFKEDFFIKYLKIIINFLENIFLNREKRRREKSLRSYIILNEKYRKVGSIIYLKSFNIILKENGIRLKDTYHLVKNQRPFLNIYSDIFKNFKSFCFQIFIQNKIYNNRFIRFLRPGF